MITRGLRAGWVGATLLLLAACGSGEPTQAELDAARAELDSTLAFATKEWPTDWTRSSVGLDELVLGVGATEPRDAIPPIDRPVFESTNDAAIWLGPDQPGALVQVGGVARFYPLAIMTRHEIVNDVIGDVPVAVTYCPLCNTALAFDRRVAGDTLRFGVSGVLRNSDLVMWDDTTVSLWQQITGEAIVGERVGARLEPVSTAIVAFGDFADAFPVGESLSRDTGFDLDYGLNRYEGYSTRITPLFPVAGDRDSRLPDLERVVGVSIADTHRAYPFALLAEVGAINDEVADVPVVVFWGAPDTLDPLNRERIEDSRAIGAAAAFDPVVGGRRLTFDPVGEGFRDRETGSSWTVIGHAIHGPLTGTVLPTLLHRNEFWFAWVAFFPDGELFVG